MDSLLDAAESVQHVVDGVGQLTRDSVATPLIKARAFVAGTSQAARRIGRPKGAKGSMFKRLRWMLLGAIGGISSSVYVQRRLRERMDRLQPDHVARRAMGVAQNVGREVKGAVTEGRQVMRSREIELREGYLSERS